MHPQPLISVRDVEASSRWYQGALGLASGHGGREYERLLSDGTLVLQLHLWGAHEHPHLGDTVPQPGSGVALWFQTDDFTGAHARIKETNVEVLEGPFENENANHREVWIRDPDGYVVVIAGSPGDLG